jgi:hypothetical protein
VQHPSGQEHRSRQRRAIGSLEHTKIALEGQADSDVVVTGGDHRERRHPCDVVRGECDRATAKHDVAVSEQRREDRQEHEWEYKREERRCGVTPEGLVHVSKLRHGQNE